MPSKPDDDGIFPLRHSFLLLEIVDGSFASTFKQKPVDGTLGIGGPSLNTLEGVPTFIGSLKNLLKMPKMTFRFKYLFVNIKFTIFSIGNYGPHVSTFKPK
jgi:hypothetical protein